MHKDQPRWVKAPQDKGLDVPFLKAFPVKALDNDHMEYSAETSKGKIKVQASIKDTFEMSKGQLYQDMCSMNVLNQPEVLRNITERYKQDEIFTYIGPTLIVVNPYRIIERHFNSKLIAEVREKVLKGNLNAAPHIYMIAGRAYQGLIYGQGKQAVVISGESGAGKTESTKYCMQMITSLSHKESHSIEKKILACNPLLQAFGNSKTVRNDNSSRFGKYVQIFFGGDHTIKGANITSYLLEKSRVVSVAPNQRAFHAFYALAASGALGVKPPQHYNYLKQSNCYSANNIDDAAYYKEINTSMDQIGFKKQEQKKIWSIVAAILNLGNLQFDDQQHQTNQSNPCDLKSKKDIPKIAEVVGISPESLEKLLLWQKKVILKETTYKPYTKLGCIGNRNTLAKALYNSIFQFIIYKIQLVLNPHSHERLNSINLLDIFGFQNFKTNSLEQLCINFTNEKLLKQYNRYVFQNQMVILNEDGLQRQVQNINPPTNDYIISLLSDKTSLFSAINDYTPNAQFKDEDMILGFQRDFPKSKFIKFDLIKKTNFTIVHSQCEVTYNVQGFKLKNQDRVSSEIIDVYSKLFINQNKSQTGKTLLSKFVKEIQDLVNELSSASNHFVRCIKPNEDKVARKIQENYILTQVRYLGVFETIQIRQKTFPARKLYSEFLETFQPIFHVSKGKQGRDAIIAILRQVQAKERDYLLGRKRVYMNKQLEDKLNKVLYQFFKIKNEKASKIQKQMRAFIFRRKVLKNLKVLVKRKKLWIKFAFAQRKKIMYSAFDEISKYAKYLKMKQVQKQQKGKEALLIKEMQLKINKDSTLKNHSEQVSDSKKQSTKENVSLTSILKKESVPSLHHDLNETIVLDQGQAPYKLKPREKPAQKTEGQFNQSFREGDTTFISSNPDVIFEKTIVLDMYQEGSKHGKLNKLKKILAEQYKLEISGSQEEFFSPNSQDCTFHINDTPPEHQNKIIHFEANQFFQRVLRKRTNFIGIAKDYTDVLVAKDRPMTKTLTLMPEEDSERALKVFKVIIRIGEETKLDNVFKLIENMVALCQTSTQELKNEVFLQLIKQTNSEHELAAIRVYQSMAVFLHIYIPDQDFVLAGLYIFYRRLQDNKNSQKEEEYLRYLFKKMLRRIENPPTIGYMPIKYQMMALMCKRQISIPVYLPVGNSILIRVESYDTFSDIKERVIAQFGINSRRLRPEMFRFFEIVNFENQELEESPLNENQIVWDIMTYWQRAKEKYKEANSPPPAFFLMLKVVYAFEIHPQDIEGIELCFAQCYFDYFIGRIKLDFSAMAALAACVKKIKLSSRPQHQILGSYPIWISKKHPKEELAAAMVDNIRQMEAEGLTELQMKYRFLEVCSQYPLAMAMGVPTDQPIKLYFKPKKIYLTQKGEIQSEYSMRVVEKWAIDSEKFVFDIKGGSVKTQVIFTEYAFVCSQFLSELPKLLKRNK